MAWLLAQVRVQITTSIWSLTIMPITDFTRFRFGVLETNRVYANCRRAVCTAGDGMPRGVLTETAVGRGPSGIE